jgi:hypothetical protein
MPAEKLWRPVACFRRALLAAVVLSQTAVAVVALNRVMPLEIGHLADTLLISL